MQSACDLLGAKKKKKENYIRKYRNLYKMLHKIIIKSNQHVTNYIELTEIYSMSIDININIVTI